MSKEITVQIKVEDYNEEFYIHNGYNKCFILKDDCTVVSATVDHVQPEPNDDDLKFCAHPLEKFNAFPKLIAKAGEWVKIVSMGKITEDLKSFMENKPYKLREDFYEDGIFRVELDNEGIKNGLYTRGQNVKFEVCPAPVQRKSIGFYEGVEIFENNTVYFIDIKKLKIEPEKIRECGIWLNKDDSDCSKMYLSPKEADKRLKEEVKKVAKERTFTIGEIEYWIKSSSTPEEIVDYAIELAEKEFNVKYLQD